MCVDTGPSLAKVGVSAKDPNLADKLNQHFFCGSGSMPGFGFVCKFTAGGGLD